VPSRRLNAEWKKNHNELTNICNIKLNSTTLITLPFKKFGVKVKISCAFKDLK